MSADKRSNISFVKVQRYNRLHFFHTQHETPALLGVSDVNKDWTYKDQDMDKDQSHKDKDKDWTYKDKDKDQSHKDKDKDLTYKDKDKDWAHKDTDKDKGLTYKDSKQKRRQAQHSFFKTVSLNVFKNIEIQNNIVTF